MKIFQTFFLTNFWQQRRKNVLGTKFPVKCAIIFNRVGDIDRENTKPKSAEPELYKT